MINNNNNVLIIVCSRTDKICRPVLEGIESVLWVKVRSYPFLNCTNMKNSFFLRSSINKEHLKQI